MNGLEFLRAEHDKVLAMLDAVEGAPRDAGMNLGELPTMVSNLIIAESQHEAIEEQWFWPVVRKTLPDGDALADRGVAQEQEGKRLLQRLLGGRHGNQDYHGALAEFIAAAREHIAYEQDVVWPDLRMALSREELDRMGERLSTAKKVAPTRPHPLTPPSGVVQKTVGLPVAVLDHLRDTITGRSAD